MIIKYKNKNHLRFKTIIQRLFFEYFMYNIHGRIVLYTSQTGVYDNFYCIFGKIKIFNDKKIKKKNTKSHLI